MWKWKEFTKDLCWFFMASQTQPKKIQRVRRFCSLERRTAWAVLIFETNCEIKLRLAFRNCAVWPEMGPMDGLSCPGGHSGRLAQCVGQTWCLSHRSFVLVPDRAVGLMDEMKPNHPLTNHLGMPSVSICKEKFMAIKERVSSVPDSSSWQQGVPINNQSMVCFRSNQQ